MVKGGDAHELQLHDLQVHAKYAASPCVTTARCGIVGVMETLGWIVCYMLLEIGIALIVCPLVLLLLGRIE